LALRAVIFDYGMVLTGTPNEAAHDAMVRITGLPPDRFEALYWTDRHAYDEGKLTGMAFWQKLVRDAQLDLSQSTIEELNEWDARMWTTQNPAMVAWQVRLKQHGLKTAILSNMGDSVLARIEREFAWINGFDVLVWSYQLLMAKPDPQICMRSRNSAPSPTRRSLSTTNASTSTLPSHLECRRSNSQPSIACAQISWRQGSNPNCRSPENSSPKKP